jgi:hypothetical protein
MEKRLIQKVLKGSWWGFRSAKSTLRCADGNRWVPILVDECQQRRGVWGHECGIHGRCDNPDRAAAMGIEESGMMAIEWGMKWHSIHLGWRAPSGIEDRLSLQSCTTSGYQAAHKCAIDECSGFRCNIHYTGWVKCSTIYIMRKHNGWHPSTGIFRQCTMNSCSC